MKLANQQAGYQSSLSLIRTFGAQRGSCSARQKYWACYLATHALITAEKIMHCTKLAIATKFTLVIFMRQLPFSLFQKFKRRGRVSQ